MKNKKLKKQKFKRINNKMNQKINKEFLFKSLINRVNKISKNYKIKIKWLKVFNKSKFHNSHKQIKPNIFNKEE